VYPPPVGSEVTQRTEANISMKGKHIKRKEVLQKDYRIFSKFREHFGHDRVQPFFGNESVAKLLSLFGNACAIVGAHGAGLANVMFSAPHTYVLEISTYTVNMRIAPLHPNRTISYRTNVEAGKGMNVVWDIYRLGWDSMTPPLDVQRVLKFRPPYATNFIYQHVNFGSNFVLTESDIDTIVRVTCESTNKHMIPPLSPQC